MSHSNLPSEGSQPGGHQQGFPQHDSSQHGMPAAPTGYNEAPAAVGAAPKEHSLSVKLIIASLILGVIGALLSFLNLDGIVDESLKQAQNSGQDTSSLNREQIKTIAVTTIIISIVTSVILQGLLTFFWAKGHNWARIVLTILAVFTLFTLFSSFTALNGPQMLTSILSILGSILFLAGVFLAWNKNVSAWINARKQAKLNGQMV